MLNEEGQGDFVLLFAIDWPLVDISDFMYSIGTTKRLLSVQLITSETRRGIVVATALEVDKASNCLSTIAATTMMFLHNRDYQRYALLEEVRNSLLKEPTLHDAIKIAVSYRKQELLQLEEQNNDPAEPEVVIVEDDEVVIEPVPKKKRTGNKGFTIPEELGRGGGLMRSVPFPAPHSSHFSPSSSPSSLPITVHHKKILKKQKVRKIYV
uniref:Uncharacterized protein n=1 Tax=Oryza rufipogon TaxID=4529 RepID=A0A0E0NDP2_ORYRU